MKGSIILEYFYLSTEYLTDIVYKATSRPGTTSTSRIFIKQIVSILNMYIFTPTFRHLAVYQFSGL